MADSWLLDKEKFLPIIQCPICLTIPRDVPIPQCEAGHIVCRPCNGHLTKCPTCRRNLNKNITNSVASSLVELIPHKCKYFENGCQVQDLLSSLVKHEIVCEERTIQCPLLSCSKMVQLKEFDQHVDANKCFENATNKVVQGVVHNDIVMDGNRSYPKFNVKEYGPSEDGEKYWMHKFDGKNFYFVESFSSQKEVYSYVVMMVGMNKEDVEAYSVQMVVFSNDEKFKIEFTLPVLPIDSGLDLKYEKLLDENKTFFVPLYQMKRLFCYEEEVEHIEEGARKFELVSYNIKSCIKKSSVM